MDQSFTRLLNFDLHPNSDLNPNIVNLTQLNNPSPNLSMSSESDSPSDDGDFSDSVLKYISQMLMEENMEKELSMFHDPLALQAAEKSLYEVLGEKYPPSPNQHPLYYTSDRNIESPDDHFWPSPGDSTTRTSNSASTSSSNTGNSVQSSRTYVDPSEYEPSILQTPLPVDFVFQSTSVSSSQTTSNLQDNITDNGNGNGLVGSSLNELLEPNSFSESDLMMQFKRGVEEGNKFLPKSPQLVIDLDSYELPPESNKNVSDSLVKVEKEERDHSPTELRGRKNHEREETDLEDGRSNKQSAIYMEDGQETELSEMFDKVLLCNVGKGRGGLICEDGGGFGNGGKKFSQQDEKSNKSSSGKSRSKMQENKKEVVDLRTLLILCAQAVSSYDVRTATELLKQIRQHSSPYGDGSQRLAHYFSNGLEARLAGTGTEIYASLASKRTAADMLKAYQVYVSACPFKKIAIAFANNMISKAAEKAENLHIIDFGILYGFQWPALIQCLSRRSGGPPKLRITGIEFPQHGFRPAQQVQETGRRLARYCERFNVPFEYNAIAQQWETIQIEDLKIVRDEVVAVNCLFRFKNLLDETVVVDSPRDAVLNLIRTIRPDIFVHAISNGSYNAPFFVTRFREALFQFSSWFDMSDATLDRENPMRLMYEKEFLGREIINIVACEGSERVERPETYKQWQVRTKRARFRQLPLDFELMKKLKCRVEGGYDSNFMVDEDGNWMLQGWKGRVMFASSCWIPA
ncbi:hypothetical protein FEM48_Zijuj02G0073500 [Ziziphus jujuba var. spinosa]|uniref:Scarecrow-like protein 14 n=1 Tax=Ziziphus jujuba var. spinosa TaxID=714518 RepID=A0A978VUE2_ZIZJJ|nr:hypothetical protein FEM48_Zijuj02G0073500 [Ziziphus jujuba var. spinosa]